MTGLTVRLIGSRQRAYAHSLVDKAPDAAVVNIRESTRTLEQNAKFHAMISDIARSKPQGRVLRTDTWKVLILAACGHKIRFEPALDGDGVVPVGLRSSELNKAQMSDAIEWMYAWGAEQQIEWSEPKLQREE